jgi:hypothetical protein
MMKSIFTADDNQGWILPVYLFRYSTTDKFDEIMGWLIKVLETPVLQALLICPFKEVGNILLQATLKNHDTFLLSECCKIFFADPEYTHVLAELPATQFFKFFVAADDSGRTFPLYLMALGSNEDIALFINFLHHPNIIKTLKEAPLFTAKFLTTKCNVFPYQEYTLPQILYQRLGEEILPQLSTWLEQVSPKGANSFLKMATTQPKLAAIPLIRDIGTYLYGQ